MSKKTINMQSSADASSKFEEVPEAQKPLGRNNFIAMAIAGALIVLGFVLMLGAGSTMEEFNPDIFSTRRIVVGPFMAFIGFVAMGAAIIIDPSHLQIKRKK